MAEIFLQDDIASLLDNRFIVIIGDSIQRGVYKDVVLLLQRNRYLTDNDLRAKGEFTFSGDKLIEGGKYGEMTNGVRYREVRQYQTDHHLVRFYFVTRCYNGYVESILSDLSKDPLPDAILMNSCLWDISRYGLSSVEQYKKNLETLFKRFSEVLPKTCLVVWNMTLPISKKARGGVLIPEVEHLNVSLRLDILEANFFVHKLALQYGYNTLDLHYYLRHQLQRRAGDGVHWDMTAHRRITNLILTHVAEAWGYKPPEHARKVLLKEQKLKETSNRPRNFNTDFSFGLDTGQFANKNINQQVGTLPPGQFSNRNVSPGMGLLPGPDLLSGRSMAQNMPKRQEFVQNFCNNMLNVARQAVTGPFVEAQFAVQNGNPSTRGQNQENLLPQNQFFQQEHLDEVNQRNIDRYGGPIRFTNFDGVDMANVMVPNNMEMLNRPYQHDNFNPGAVRGNWDYGQSRQARVSPYGMGVRQADHYSHAY